MHVLVNMQKNMMHSEFFLVDQCTRISVEANTDVSSFTCGDDDLDDFFHNEAKLYSEQLLGKTYAFVMNDNPSDIVCMFTLANDSIKSALIPNASRNKLQRNIPNSKRTRSYPAGLIGRLGVSVSYKGKNIGSQALDYLKYLFTRQAYLTGCRFLVVDAYNEESVLSFYSKNGFKPLYATEDLERAAFHIADGEKLHSRMFYFDLMQFLTTT